MNFIDYIISLFKLFFKGANNFFELVLNIPTFLNDFSKILPFPLKAIATFFISIFVFILVYKVLKAIIEILSPFFESIKENIMGVISSFLGGGS